MMRGRSLCAVIVLALAIAAAWACSSSGGAPSGVPAVGCASASDAGRCSANACYCEGAPVFQSDAGCSFGCGAPPDGGLAVYCSQRSCNVTCADTCRPDCSQGVCTLNVGGGSQVSCSQAQSCTGSVGPDASVECLQATCALSVGSGTTVDCVQAHVCDITCTGACSVDCSQATACILRCAPGATCDFSNTFACNPTTCADGLTKVCGAAKCP